MRGPFCVPGPALCRLSLAVGANSLPLSHRCHDHLVAVCVLAEAARIAAYNQRLLHYDTARARSAARRARLSKREQLILSTLSLL